MFVFVSTPMSATCVTNLTFFLFIILMISGQSTNDKTYHAKVLCVWLEVLTAVSMKMAVLWTTAPCRLVSVYRRFRNTDHPDVGGSTDLWNVGKLIPGYAVRQPRRQPSSNVPRLTTESIRISWWSMKYTACSCVLQSVQRSWFSAWTRLRGGTKDNAGRQLVSASLPASSRRTCTHSRSNTAFLWVSLTAVYINVLRGMTYANSSGYCTTNEGSSMATIGDKNSNSR
jgi:hypothetical protein